jgi:hypothetical protein
LVTYTDTYGRQHVLRLIPKKKEAFVAALGIQVS